MQRRFITDGCTRVGTITDSECLLHVEYRPMLPVDREILVDRVRRLAPDEASDLAAAEQIVLEELSVRIVFWTVRDAAGIPVDVSIAALRSMETTLLASLSVLVLDLDQESQEDEIRREQNLVQGVRLLLTNPRVAIRDCGDCQKYVYDETTGRRVVHANEPVVRPPGTFPPCRISRVGCSKGSPEQPRTLTAENRKVLRHYRECRATGSFPDDPIVRRNAALIQAVELQALQRRTLRREGQSSSHRRRSSVEEG